MKDDLLFIFKGESRSSVECRGVGVEEESKQREPEPELREPEGLKTPSLG